MLFLGISGKRYVWKRLSGKFYVWKCDEANFMSGKCYEANLMTDGCYNMHICIGSVDCYEKHISYQANAMSGHLHLTTVIFDQSSISM